jgi:hypothetical protein
LKFFQAKTIKKRALRDNKPIALIMMELNDVSPNPSHLEHLAGEELLKTIFTRQSLRVTNKNPRQPYKTAGDPYTSGFSNNYQSSPF